MTPLDRCGAALLLAALALPLPAPGQTPPSTASPAADGDGACSELLADGIAAAAAGDLPAAERALAGARSLCPLLIAVDRELAGLRFRQRHYTEAALLAEGVLSRAPDDEYAWELLASSRFLLGDHHGALRAWNRLGRPANQRTRVAGVRRTPESVVNTAIGIGTGDLITAHGLTRARRRTAALPTVARVRIEYRRVPGGQAEVDVALAERRLLPYAWPDLLLHGMRAAVDSRIRLDLSGPAGTGELWSADWLWQRNRRAVELGVAVPGALGLPGVLELRTGRRSGIYRLAAPGTDETTTLHESRRALTVSASDWASGRLLWVVGSSVDRWHGRGTFLGMSGAVDSRTLNGIAAVRADAASRWSRGPGARFHTVGVQAAVRSGADTRGSVWAARAGFARASAAAPPDLWPTAGTGRAAGVLLRAHPLLDRDGIISGPFVAPALGHANLELTQWLRLARPVRLGIAGFVDAAAAGARPGPGATRVAVDAGAGLRLAVPGLAGELRADLAHGLVDGATAVSVGWVPEWPGWW